MATDLSSEHERVPNSPASDELEQLLPAEPRHDATDAMRGFVWQRWLTVEAWLCLQEGEHLWIEWAEDFTIRDEAGGVRNFQATTRARRLTLGDERVLAIVSRALVRPSGVITFVWAKSDIGIEQGRPFNQPGISLWRTLQTTRESVGPLRSWLAQPGRLSEPARAVVLYGSEEDFRQQLMRVRWVTSEPGVEALRTRVLEALNERLERLKVRGVDLLSESSAALLFWKVAQTALQERHLRSLTSDDLDDALRQHRSDMDTRALAVSPGAGGAASAPLRRRIDERASLPPLSSAWFNYTGEKIPLMGRELELEVFQQFVDSEDGFRWWVMGGPAGVGKSRLARAFEALAPESWQQGFAAHGELEILEPYVRGLDASFFITIDYASVNPDGVGRFLEHCHGAAREGRRIRVLLLDRDVSAGAGWLRSLKRGSASRRAAILQASLFRAPYELPPLFGREREIVSAWLQAAGLDPERLVPPKKARVWFDIRRSTGSRPLHLGFAAAALARGTRSFESTTDLLGDMLEREAWRWRSIEPEPDRLREAIELLAVSATMQDLPVPWPGDRRPVRLQTEREMLLVVDENGKPLRLPTFEELQSVPEFEADMRALQTSHVEALKTAIGSDDSLSVFADKLATVRALTGEGWRIRPDIISEFFLAEHWRDPNEIRTSDSGVLPADDTDLGRELLAAWRLRPFSTIFTLDQLRDHRWARDAVLRALLRLADVTIASKVLDARHIERLSALLFDSLIRVGDRAPDTDASVRIVERLQRIADTFPDSRDAAYRLWKAMKHVHPTLRRENSRAYVDALFERALAFLEDRPREDYERNPFELHAADVAHAQLGFTEDGAYQTFDQIVRLADAIGMRRNELPEDRRSDLDQSLSTLYRGLSERMDLGPTAIEGREADRLRSASRLSNAVRTLVARDDLDQKSREHLANTLVAMSIFDSQCGPEENVGWHYERFHAVASGVPVSRRAPLEIEILCSLHRVQFRRGDHEAARRTLDRALRVLPRPGGRSALAVLEMVKRGLGSIDGVVVASEWLHHLQLACRTQWNLKDLEVRDRLVIVLGQLPLLIGATQDRALMEATAQLLEPALDAEPLRSALRATAHIRPMTLLRTEAESEAALKALLTYANAALDTLYLSFDLERSMANALAQHHWAFGEGFSPEIRALWSFDTVRREGGVDVTLHRHNYAGIVSITRVDIYDPTPRFLERLKAGRITARRRKLP